MPKTKQPAAAKPQREIKKQIKSILDDFKFRLEKIRRRKDQILAEADKKNSAERVKKIIQDIK